MSEAPEERALRDTMQPFPSWSEIHAAALRLQIAAAASTAGAGSR